MLFRVLFSGTQVSGEVLTGNPMKNASAKYAYNDVRAIRAFWQTPSELLRTEWHLCRELSSATSLSRKWRVGAKSLHP